MESVYLETTFVSYLVSLPARDLVIAAHQEITRNRVKNCWSYLKMINDPIVESVRSIRDQLARDFDYDVHKIFADLRAREIQHSGRLIRQVDSQALNRESQSVAASGTSTEEHASAGK